MAWINHWIPAFAGMTGGWIPACAGRLRASMPSRRIQDFLSINDGGAEVRDSAGMVKGYRDGDKLTLDPVVIPAKAGIQEAGPGC